ncbi:MAG TPA: ABC transporter permease, partial [Dermatophilaceae bacterium]|nr:ABC transporter permease [Dermatophilaceae bacterium]
PLLLTGLAAAAAFKMGLFNIGGQGQFVLGAVAASGVGLALDGVSGFVTIPLMILAGMLAGGLWAAIPGFFRVRFGTNEVITTLMLNYVAANLASYLIFGSESFWRLLTGSGKVFPQGKPVGEDAVWPAFGGGGLNLPLGFLLGCVAAVGLWALYRYTRFGFEVGVVSDSPEAARYAGISVPRTSLAIMTLSGALAGLGGASDIGDIRHTLDPKGLGQTGYGYTGIVVAALARWNPIAVVPVSLLLGALANAGRSLQGESFPAGLVGLLQGLLLFCAVSGEFLTRYRVRRATARPATAAEVEAQAA